MQRFLLVVGIVFTLLFIVIFNTTYAQEGECKKPEGSSQSDLQKIITACNTQIQQLGQKRNTLSSQIQYFNSQIYLTQLQIAENEKKVDQLKDEIQNLSSRIEELDTTFQKVTNSVNKKIEQVYKKQRGQTYYAFFAANNFPEFLRSLHYLQKTQKNDRNFLLRLQNTRLTYKEQKSLREQKEDDLKTATEKLQSYRRTLATQQQEKRTLLDLTRNDEQRYQQLLAQAQQELSGIQQAVSFLQKSGEAITVKRGQIIGTQGNTGYSTGDHLHFGVYRYSSINQVTGSWYLNNYIDPAEALTSRSVLWNTGCEDSQTKTIGSGSFQWPIDITSVSQGSGYTCYGALFYNGNPHPAWDMVGPKNTPIYAADDGIAYYCRNCLGDGGNGVFIFHNNGLMTIYWHLQ